MPQYRDRVSCFKLSKSEHYATLVDFNDLAMMNAIGRGAFRNFRRNFMHEFFVEIFGSVGKCDLDMKISFHRGDCVTILLDLNLATLKCRRNLESISIQIMSGSQILASLYCTCLTKFACESLLRERLRDLSAFVHRVTVLHGS